MADGDVSDSQQDQTELGRMRERLMDYHAYDESSLNETKSKRFNRRKKNLAKMIKLVEGKKEKVSKDWEKDFPWPPFAGGAAHTINKSGQVDAGSQRDTVDAGNGSDTIDTGNQDTYHDVGRQNNTVSGRSEEQIHSICKVARDTPDRDLVIKKARVLILVNVDFDNLENRDEAKEDYKKLNKVLIEEMGYENFFVQALTKLGLDKTREFRGMTAEFVNEFSWNRDQMLAVIKKLANTEYDGDALMLFVNSHGSNIQGRDAVAGTEYILPVKTGERTTKGVVMVDEIIEILNDKKCPASVRKIPKFLFVQACRGKKKIPTSDIIVKDGKAQNQSTGVVVYDVLPPEQLEKMSLEEETAVTPDSGVPASADATDSRNTRDQGDERWKAESAQGSRVGEIGEAVAGASIQPILSVDPTSNGAVNLEARALHPLRAKEYYEAQGARPKVPLGHSRIPPTPDFGIPYKETEKAAGDTTPDASTVTVVKNVSLPNIPENFLIVYAAPKGCMSGRLRFSLDPLINEGSIFTQTFALHLEKCLSDPSFTDNPGDRGIALLPLLTGVQNEISMRPNWLEIGVLEHRLRKLPVLGKNISNVKQKQYNSAVDLHK